MNSLKVMIDFSSFLARGSVGYRPGISSRNTDKQLGSRTMTGSPSSSTGANWARICSRFDLA
ncbi:hypothetical protein D3C81_1897850 [compost metagenome]